MCRDGLRALLLLVLLSLLASCGWVTFGDDDAASDGDADADADAVVCRGELCLVSGGIRTLQGPALGNGRIVVHSDGLELTDRTCGGSLCATGGFEP